MSLVVNAHQITYADYSRALDALQTDNNFLTAAELLLKAVTAWGFPQEVSLDAFMKLPFPEAAPLLSEIVKELAAQLEKLDLSLYQVNMRKWTYLEFHEFNEAQKAKDIDTILGMLTRISYRDGQPIAFEGLSLADGNAITRLGTEAIGKVFAAKN